MSIRDVTVAFGPVRAVDGVSLEVAAGETVAVVGPSGSGKSTLLRAIAGLEPLVAGEIRAGGRSLDGVPVPKRDLGLMFQDHALFPHLDVATNVAFGLRMKRWPVERQRARVAELLALVGLDGLGRRAVHELSGGEAQRVALARALAPEPALLMLDEPFGSLDRVLREQLTAEVRRLLQELGQTALHVTHDQGEAFALADRVAVLAAGRLVQVGEPAELWHRPATGFVAEFLGHPNRWPATIGAGGVVTVAGVELGRISGGPVGEPGGAGVGAAAGAVDGVRGDARVDGDGVDGGVGPNGGAAGAEGNDSGLVTVVVPVTALVAAGPEGVLQVEVGSVGFAQGRYRATGRLMAGGGGASSPAERPGRDEAPVEVVWEADEAPVVGSRVRLAVRADRIWPIRA